MTAVEAAPLVYAGWMSRRISHCLLLLGLACAPAQDPSDPPTGESPPDSDAPLDGEPGDSAAPEGGGEIEELGGSALIWSHEGGWAAGPFDLTLRSPIAGSQLWYTLDGSDPADSPTVAAYMGPIPVVGSTILRVAVTGARGPVGPTVGRSFLFADQVADQAAPASWPDSWSPDYGSGGYNAPHYGVLAEVVEADPEAFAQALAALPVLSLVMDPVDLWGATGIYDHAWEEGAAWERPVSMELYAADEAPVSINAAVRIYGGASRFPDRSPKKTFRLLFKADYGPAKLQHRLYPDGGVQRFDGLILRASYNQSWIHWDPTQRSRGQLLRDPFARATQRAMGWPAPRSRPTHLFLNGLYWGVYDISERADAHYFADLAGGGDFDVLNAGEAIDGDLEHWTDSLAVAAADDGSEGALAALEARVDADALIDYMLLNLWAGNDDWPEHNWYAARQRSEDGRWRFISWDAEHTLKDLSTDRTGVSAADSPASFFVAFCKHERFVTRLGLRAQTLLAEGGALSPDAAVARYLALADALEPAMVAESARWGSYRRDVYCYATAPCPLYTVGEHWIPERERIVGDYLPARSAIVADQLRARGWWPD